MTTANAANPRRVLANAILVALQMTSLPFGQVSLLFNVALLNEGGDRNDFLGSFLHQPVTRALDDHSGHVVATSLP